MGVFCSNLQNNPPIVDEPGYEMCDLDIIIHCFCEVAFSTRSSISIEVKESRGRKKIATGPYIKIFHSRMGMIHLSILVRRSCTILQRVSVKPFKSVPFGWDHLLGNKGFVAAELIVLDFKVLVCSVHLAPHKGNDEIRKNPLEKIVTTLESAGTCDAIVIGGDFNSQQTSPDHLVARCVYLGDVSTLLNGDELRGYLHALSPITLFSRNQWFEPGEIIFMPTYKIDATVGSYSHKRTPAFTDRIIFSASRPSSLIPFAYHSRPDMRNSDHIPVFGGFYFNPVRD